MRLSINQKIMLLMTVMFLIFAGSITAVQGYYVMQLLTHETHAHSAEYISKATDLVADAVLTENLYKARNQILDFTSGNPEIAYLFIINDRKKILAHSFLNGFPRDMFKVIDQTEVERGRPLILETERGRIMHSRATLLSPRVGSIHLGVYVSQTQGRLFSILYYAFKAIGVMMIVCLIAT